MRAKLIYEKFEKDTDPIKDMGIGKIDFSEAWREIMSPAEMEWDQYVSQFVGKTISGKMTQLSKMYAHKPEKKKIKIMDYDTDITSGIIVVQDELGVKYQLLSEDELYIIE